MKVIPGTPRIERAKSRKGVLAGITQKVGVFLHLLNWSSFLVYKDNLPMAGMHGVSDCLG